MTLAELEIFFRDNRIGTVTIVSAPQGWQLGVRAYVGSPLHLPEAGTADSYRIFRAPTIEGALAEMAGAVPPLVASSIFD